MNNLVRLSSRWNAVHSCRICCFHLPALPSKKNPTTSNMALIFSSCESPPIATVGYIAIVRYRVWLSLVLTSRNHFLIAWPLVAHSHNDALTYRRPIELVRSLVLLTTPTKYIELISTYPFVFIRPGHIIRLDWCMASSVAMVYVPYAQRRLH